MKVAVFGNKFNNEAAAYVKALFDLLVENSQIGLVINFEETNKIDELIKEIKSIDNQIEINLINKHDII